MSNQTNPNEVDPSTRWAEIDPTNQEVSPDVVSADLRQDDDLAPIPPNPSERVEAPAPIIPEGLEMPTQRDATESETHNPLNKSKRKIAGSIAAIGAAGAIIAGSFIGSGGTEEEAPQEQTTATETFDDEQAEKEDVATEEILEHPIDEHGETASSEEATPSLVANEYYLRYTTSEELPDEKIDVENVMLDWWDASSEAQFRGEMAPNQAEYMQDVLDYYERLIAEGEVELEQVKGLSLVIPDSFFDGPIEIIHDPIIFSNDFGTDFARTWHLPTETNHKNYLLLYPTGVDSDEIAALSVQEEGIGWQTNDPRFFIINALLRKDISIERVDLAAGELPTTRREVIDMDLEDLLREQAETDYSPTPGIHELRLLFDDLTQ
jgi:hypothetical protein